MYSQRQRQSRLASLRQNRLASLRSKKASPMFSEKSLEELHNTTSAFVDAIGDLFNLAMEQQDALEEVMDQAEHREDVYQLNQIKQELQQVSYQLQNLVKKSEFLAAHIYEECNELGEIGQF
jgi:type VI protein secretion system component VasF